MDLTSAASSTTDYFYTGVVVLVISSLLSAAAAAVFIWDKMRTKPPLHETYLSKQDFLRHEEANRLEGVRLDGEIKSIRSYNAKTTREIFDEIRKMNTSINKELQDINKSVGRLEGELKKKD